MARGAGCAADGRGGVVLLGFYWFLVVLGRLGRVLVELRKHVTFCMPSRITYSIPDSEDLNQNLACLLSM
jgi:hypothetical protein